MKRIRYAIAASFAAALALVVAAAPVNAAAPTKLTATVGPGFTITLKKGTKKVTTLKPGAYSITVQDKSSAPQLPPDRARPEPEDDGRRGQDEDLGRHVQEGKLPVRVRPARELDEGQLLRQVRGSSAIWPSSIVKAARSPVRADRIK